MLDLVLSEYDNQQVRVSECPDPLVRPDSYHPALEVLLSLRHSHQSPVVHIPPSRRNPLSAPNWNFRKADFQGLYEAVRSIDWTDLLSETDINRALMLFYDRINDCINQYVPLKKLNRSKHHIYPVWYTPEIIRNIKHKHCHLVKYKSQQKQYNKEMYKYYRSHVKMLIQTAHQNYIETIEQGIKKTPTKFWKYIKDKRKSRNRCHNYTFEGKTFTGQEAADKFAAFFSSVFQDKIPTLDVTDAQRSGVSGSYFYAHRISVNSICIAEVRDAVKRLRSQSSPGPDEIPPYLVKDCISTLENPLLYIYNLIIERSQYPLVWKLSKVTPIPKGGIQSDGTLFRPIAVLSVFGKVFENILDCRISAQIRTHLSDCQHGFRSQRSTATCHINFTDYVTEEMDSGRQVDATYFDFRKAFDTVDNDILLAKMAAIGFTPKLLRLFANYLQDRRQYVRLDGYDTDCFYTRSGVSQGSTLGPTLFLIMVNDLPTFVNTAKCIMFADDLKLYLSVQNMDDCRALQQDIASVARWSSINRLAFNASKCKIVSFARARQPIQVTYTIDDIPLERVDKVRDLGVWLDHRLDFRDHMISACKDATKALGFIMRASSSFGDTGVATTLYKAFVRSKLEYNAIVWDPYEDKYTLMLERVQRRFARFLYKRKFGYYPYLYPSMFVSGMVGLAPLKTRRKLLLLKHYCGLLANTVDNPNALGRIGLAGIPSRDLNWGSGCTGPRRRRKLFACAVRTRTRRAEAAPSARAIIAMNDMLAQYPQLDLFSDTVGTIRRHIHLYLRM